MNEEQLNEKWNNRKLIEETISSMGEHNNPSPETREQLAILKTNYNYLMEKVDEIIARFDKFEQKLDCALDKKANVWVEKVLIWFGGIIGVGIIGFLGSLIVKLIEL